MPRIPEDIDLIRSPRSALRVVPVTPRESGLQDFGASLQRVGEREMEKEDRFNYARAESAFLARQSEVMDGLTDDDYGSYGDRYRQGVKDAINESMGMIASKTDRSVFELEMERLSQRGLERIRERARVKEADFGRSKLDETLTGNRKLALVAPDDLTRNRYIRSGVEAIEGARERNYLDSEAATNLRQGWIQDVAKSSLEVMEPRERLGKIDEAGFLPEDVRVDLKRRTEREIKALDREAEIEAERERVRYRKVLSRQVDDAAAAYMQGLEYESPPTESDFLDAYGEEGTERYQEFQKLQELGSDINTVATATPEERSALLTGREPKVGPGFAGESQRFNTLLKAAQSLEKAKQTDPVSYITQHFGEIEDRGELLAEQERLGVESPKLLTQPQAREIAQRFSETDEDGGGMAASVIESLEEDFGEHWPIVFEQLSEVGVPPEALVIGSGVTPDVAERLSRLAPIKTDELKAGLDRKAGTDVGDALSDVMQPFQRSLALQGGQRTFSTFYGQAERLAYQYMTQGADAEDASNRAYEELIGRKYAFEETYRIPLVSEDGRPYDPGRIADGAGKALAQIKPEAIGGEIEGVSEDFVSQRREEILADAYWVTDGRERGLVLHYNGAAVPGKDGKEIRVAFDDLESQGSTFMEKLKALTERLSPGRVLFPLPSALLKDEE